jgi:hypothetical protein
MTARNAYYLIRDESDPLPVLEGFRFAGVYYGAARVLAPITTNVEPVEGDELHVLLGGTFLVRAGKVVGEVIYSEATDARVATWIRANMAVETTSPTRVECYR